ncbi:MAG TPA: hypothetical protein VHP83_21305, partial [Aggregatilineaceae bacterium]|nr:hypothetical protein [Aggregatilineaceae bacterium]
TVLTTTALLCGLLLIVFAEHSVDEWESRKKLSTDRRRVYLALLMLALYGVIFAISPFRKFFELNTMSWGDLGVVFIAVVSWALAVRSLWRYDVFERMLVPSQE